MKKKTLLLWMITLPLLLAGCFSNTQEKKESEIKQEIQKVKEVKENVTFETSKKQLSEIPAIKKVKDPYYMQIRLTIEKDNKKDVSVIDFYRKDDKLKLIYKSGDSIMSQWPFPWTTLKEIYEMGDKTYSCIDFRGETTCLHDKESGAIEIFDFEYIINLVKQFPNKEKKTVNWKEVICYTEPNIWTKNQTCIYEKDNIVQISENRNDKNALILETLKYETKVDDSVFEFNLPTSTTQDFFNKHSEYLIPLMQKAEEEVSKFKANEGVETKKNK